MPRPHTGAVRVLICAGALAQAALAVAQPAAPPTTRARPKPPTEEQSAAAAIERTLRKHGPEVHRCFEKALADRLDAAGKIEIELDVVGGGRVKGAKVLSQGREVPPAMVACVQAAATSWVIEGVEAGSSVVLPFAFQGQAAQFVIKAADVPDRGPPAPKGRGGSTAEPSFRVKVLADEVNVRAQNVSLTLLTVGPASRVAMHRHPKSAKALYLLKGHARLLGPAGVAPIKMDQGTAVFLPQGYPHVIENMGRQQPAAFLQIFAPPGPERVYRDPTDAQARSAFEVIRDPSQIKVAPTDPKAFVISRDQAEVLTAFGGKGKVRILLDEKVTGSAALSLSIVDFAAGMEIPRHQHDGSTELLYVTAGAGDLIVGSESHPFSVDSALHVPASQPHGGRIGGEPITAIQIFAPAGPEQRFRAPAPAGTPPAPPPAAAPAPATKK